ncbi:MAG: hypothetical protein CBC59_007420 [Euryarchaeota archaeon TMED99]|nr:MAG: hypothetical protein CBC59_007420 [Euryarchaeota archaeon TMED99]
MRSSVLVAFLLCVMLIPSSSLAAEGRAEPGCLNDTPAAFSSATVIGDGACIKINLGVLTPGDVYDLSIIVSQDELDVLVFDQNSIQPYDLGQSYRNLFEQVPSTESALGSYQFHWQVPSSINAKAWYIVFDNTAHSGDQGMGDQGGVDSRASLTVSKITDSYWTPFHNLIAVENDSSDTLLSGADLQLDAGTSIVVTAWSLEGNGDIYLQTRAMNDLYTSGGVGSLYITGAALQSVEGSSSFSWIVPNELDGEELILVADNTDTPVGGANGDSPVRMTVRVELAPQLNPIISDDSNSSTVVGNSIMLDAYSTPNRLNQIASASWDFDAGVDADGDGDFTNDEDATGWDALATWSTPGDRTVTLTVASPIGSSASSTSVISVLDVVNPVARIGGNGQPISGGWKLTTGDTILLNCDGSTDDHVVSVCAWNLDGNPYGQNSSVSFSWSDIGTHEVTLTVSDASGNSNSISTTLLVTDTTIPVLNQSSLVLLPSVGQVGDEITCTVQATDSYDSISALRYHWDLNPEVDSDGNGDSRDDADLTGSSVDLEFAKSGQYDVVVTVFDQSNNSDSHAFTLNIEAPPEKGSIVGILLMVLFIGTLTMGIALLGHRRWQNGIAKELLMGRGLSEVEADAHMATVASTRKIPLFSTAVVLAGLDAGEVQSSTSKVEEEKAAEIAAIYGDQSTSEMQGNSAFAPPSFAQQTISQGSQAAAADAMALFNDETPAPLTQPTIPAAQVSGELYTSAPQTVVKSGGVSLPEGVNTPSPKTVPEISVPQVQPEPTTKSVACSGCSTVFEVQIPPGANTVVVACPTCSRDTTVSA